MFYRLKKTDGKVHRKYYIPKVEKKKIKMLLLMEKKLFNQPIKMIWEHMVTIQRLQLVKEIIIQLAVY